MTVLVATHPPSLPPYRRRYEQPREDVRAECGLGPGDAQPIPAGCCAWAAPVVAPGAWANGTLPLGGKATQPLQLRSGVVPASVTQLGPGWFVADLGAEVQVRWGGRREEEGGRAGLSLPPPPPPFPLAGRRGAAPQR